MFLFHFFLHKEQKWYFWSFCFCTQNKNGIFRVVFVLAHRTEKGIFRVVFFFFLQTGQMLGNLNQCNNGENMTLRIQPEAIHIIKVKLVRIYQILCQYDTANNMK